MRIFSLSKDDVPVLGGRDLTSRAMRVRREVGEESKMNSTLFASVWVSQYSTVSTIGYIP